MTATNNRLSIFAFPLASGESAIGEAFIRHLDAISEVTAEDRRALLGIHGRVVDLIRGESVVRQGDHPHDAVVVLAGLIQRFVIDAEGRRQIEGLFIPTDTPGLESLHIGIMDNTLAAVCPSKVALVPHTELFTLMDLYPRLTGLFWRETLIQGAISRAWLTRNSIKLAHAQMAHLFCEMLTRSQAAGLATGNSCELPISQEDLADALGVSPVHVNRTLMLLRSTGAVEFQNHRLTVPDFDKLAEIADFDPGYLQLKRRMPGQ